MFAIYLIDNNYYIVNLKKYTILAKFLNLNQAIQFLIELIKNNNSIDSIARDFAYFVNKKEKNSLKIKLRKIIYRLNEFNRLQINNIESDYLLKTVFNEKNELIGMYISDLNIFLNKDINSYNIENASFVTLIDEKDYLSNDFRQALKIEKERERFNKLVFPFAISIVFILLFFISGQIFIYNLFIKKVLINFSSSSLKIEYNFNYKINKIKNDIDCKNNINQNQIVEVKFNSKIKGLFCTNINEYKDYLEMNVNLIQNKLSFQLVNIENYKSTTEQSIIKEINLNFEALNAIKKETLNFCIEDKRVDLKTNPENNKGKITLKLNNSDKKTQELSISQNNNNNNNIVVKKFEDFWITNLVNVKVEQSSKKIIFELKESWKPSKEKLKNQYFLIYSLNSKFLKAYIEIE